MPPARLAGFAIVWLALAVFTVDSLRHARARTAVGRSRQPVPAGSDAARVPARRCAGATGAPESSVPARYRRRRAAPASRSGRCRAGDERSMTSDPAAVVSPPRADGSGEWRPRRSRGRGADPAGARDARLRAAVVAAGRGQGDGDPRPVRRDRRRATTRCSTRWSTGLTRSPPTPCWSGGCGGCARRGDAGEISRRSWAMGVTND